MTKKGYNVIVSELPKLYEKNGITLSDNVTQTDFLNQIEIRARRRNILSYAFFMRSYTPRAKDILIFEIPKSNKTSDEIFNKVIKQLQVFSFLGQMDIPDRKIFQIPGISHTHPISKLIQEVLIQNNLETIFYTINLNEIKFVPLHDLYSFDDQKWMI